MLHKVMLVLLNGPPSIYYNYLQMHPIWARVTHQTGLYGLNAQGVVRVAVKCQRRAKLDGMWAGNTAAYQKSLFGSQE